MTLAECARVAHERRRTIATLTTLGALSFLAYGWSQPPTFSATAQLFVSATGDPKLGVDSAPWLEQRVHTYAELATSPEVLTGAGAQLQPSVGADQLAGKVRAAAVPGTVLLDVTVTELSPTRARDLANAIAGQLPTVVSRIERTGPGAAPAVQVQLARPADEPRAPVSPGRAAAVLTGLLAGLGLGLVTALVRGALDGTVRSRAQAGQAAQAPVLAQIVDDPEAHRRPLITSDAFAPRTEAFRQLRTGLRLRAGDQPARSIVVTSAQDGEGRTTTACNLAIALAQSGENVVLIDADLRNPSVADLLGLPERNGLTCVLTGELGIVQALQPWRIDLALRVLVAGPAQPNPSELIGSPRMAALVTALADSGATVVLDSPALLPVTDGVVLARLADGAVVVARAGSTSREHLGQAADELRACGATVLGTVLNRTSRRASTGPRGLTSGYGTASPGWDRRGAERTAPGDTLAASVSTWELPAVPDHPEAPVADTQELDHFPTPAPASARHQQRSQGGHPQAWSPPTHNGQQVPRQLPPERSVEPAGAPATERRLGRRRLAPAPESPPPQAIDVRDGWAAYPEPLPVQASAWAPPSGPATVEYVPGRQPGAPARRHRH